MNDLMQKLAISKKIMDKHNEVPRGQSPGLSQVTENVNASYNIPEEMLTSEKPVTNNNLNEDAIMGSKLPDEIKKLMLENPIVQPQMTGPTLSDELIEGASRLMNNKTTNVTETVTNTNNTDMRQMIRDVVRDTVRDVVREELSNAGLVTENSKNTSESLSLRVGKHVFEGKVLKIKKVK